MPRLWNETIEAHRRDVHQAILDTTAELVTERGLRSVTMAQIAERTGIGRATLYKYFPDVEAILVAWHDQHVAGHLQNLADARSTAADPATRLHAVLAAYAHIAHEMSHRHPGTELSALLHRDERVAHAQQQLHDLVRDALTEAAHAGIIRADVTPDELATYCLHSLTAAGDLPSTESIGRLVTLTLAGLQPDER
ncbi:TetR/AcrR family transcriptional regulator [Nonomuraea guangzhouensis]|uniref:TetR/AcrR family transcriptional regulator n=1 Tax=Nonomuraea guangzhouensis TaxID=1291555 RepID=A0ABW4G2N8_9ACTN|nr:TetR/AcrR family transcriptional regulator [Nonomuraea guangzhouensis]